MVQKKDIDTLCIITGPTCSGKSYAAMAAAIKTGGEIVGCDSMQIYRGMDIGTAKPTLSDRAKVPHHMIDVCGPRENFTVSLYRDGADAAIKSIMERGRKAYVTGGTGLYIRALLYSQSLGGTGAADGAVRDSFIKVLETGGKERLYAILKETDPETAEALHVNDVKRVIRALEIAAVSGSTKSRLIKADAENTAKRYRYKLYVLNPDRAALYKNIDRRVDEMINAGLIEETRSLLKNGCTADMNSMKAIGYAESIRHIAGELTLDGTAALIKKNTRNYAKRQMTFFRGFRDAIFLPVTEIGIEKCIQTIL